MHAPHHVTSPSGLSERLFVWTELALSRVLARIARARRAPGGGRFAPR